MNTRRFKAAMSLVDRDIAHLQRVRASIQKKIADHDVIDDYVEERKEDLDYQRKSMSEYLRDVERKVSGARTRRNADGMDLEDDEPHHYPDPNDPMVGGSVDSLSDLEASLDELEASERTAKAKVAKGKSKRAEEDDDEDDEDDKKAAVKARAMKIINRVDAAANRLEIANPKLAKKLDMVSNTLEKKYGLGKKATAARA